MRSLNCTIFVTLFLTVSTTVFAVPYKGVGGQIEAYGTVTATFFIGQKASEICGRYPSLKKESVETARKYMAKNKPVFDRVSQHLRQLAEKNGGEAERRRLNTEIEAAMPELDKDAALELGKIATSAQACSEILSNLRRGNWDLQVRNARELEAILGSREQTHPPSFIKGILEGCIDGQKRQLSQQGLSYQGNEELVRQYCHCMAPLTADIASTADGRAKLMDGDTRIKARVQKMEAICLDGLKNGRNFAP